MTEYLLASIVLIVFSILMILFIRIYSRINVNSKKSEDLLDADDFTILK